MRNIAKNPNAAVIGICETKLSYTVYDPYVAIDGYNIVQSNRNRGGGGVGSYFKNNICFNLKTCLSNNIGNIFIDLLFPKAR